MTPGEHETDTTPNDGTAAPTPLATFLAPYTCLLAPARAAELLATARKGTYAVAFSIWILALVSVLLGLEACEVYIRDKAPAVPPEWGTTACWMFSLTALYVMLAVLVLAWLWWPWVHREGPLAASYWRTVRVVGGTLGPASLCVAVLRLHFVLEAAGFSLDDTLGWYAAFVPPWCIFGMLICTLWWVDRAVLAMADAVPGPLLPPRCEGCGYDLTYRPESGRCPECGLVFVESLVESLHRPGSAWSQERSVRGWLRTTLDVLLRPTAFYGKLRLRTRSTAERGFVTWTLLAMWLALFVWSLGMLLLWAYLNEYDLWMWFDPLSIAAMVTNALGSVLRFWLLHRVTAAAVATWCFVRKSLPDGRWLAKICTYETAFIWAIVAAWCLFSGAVQLLRTLGAGTQFPGSQWYLGMPLYAWLWLGVTVAPVPVWLWRYWIACRAVRWNNF
ncbi:MAG: hypothetical protein PVJ57_18145 [Phycisphaerae bacterium]